jgi:hypothetical protein
VTGTEAIQHRRNAETLVTAVFRLSRTAPPPAITAALIALLPARPPAPLEAPAAPRATASGGRIGEVPGSRSAASAANSCAGCASAREARAIVSASRRTANHPVKALVRRASRAQERVLGAEGNERTLPAGNRSRAHRVVAGAPDERPQGAPHALANARFQLRDIKRGCALVHAHGCAPRPQDITAR